MQCGQFSQYGNGLGIYRKIRLIPLHNVSTRANKSTQKRKKERKEKERRKKKETERKKKTTAKNGGGGGDEEEEDNGIFHAFVSYVFTM